MAFSLLVIAGVDEATHSTAGRASGEGDATLHSRSFVYVSREHCIQHKLRNAVVALALPSAAPGSVPIYASVKVYSKESALFRKDPRFPAKLVAHGKEAGSATSWPVVVSSVVWWEIVQRVRMHALSEEIQGDLAMPAGHGGIALDARVVSKLGNATVVTVAVPEAATKTPLITNGAAMAQSLSGFVASLHGWIVFKSPYGTQALKVTQIKTTDDDCPDVGFVSEATSFRYVPYSNAHSTSSIASPVSTVKRLVSRDAWITSVNQVIGGYDDVLAQIIDRMYVFLESAINDTENTMASSPHSRPCCKIPYKGILIYGRPGTGKSRLASRIAECSGLPYTMFNCPDVFQTDAGASENYLRDAFRSLLSRGKASILILDEVDMIASNRASRKGVEAKLFATLLHLVDIINTHPGGNKIFIIALTNRLHAVDSSLLRSGRLDKIFDLHLKGAEQRLRVLEIVSKDLPMDPEQRPEILRKVARATHGFVPTDLQSLCTESALLLISRMAAGVNDAMIDFSYFERAMKTVRPSGMGEFLSKIPAVSFRDLFGIEDAIADLRASIIAPFQNPSRYIEMGIAPPRGLLIHGPPGVGKTMLCCALAEELGINFMLVESSQIRSKVVGESEQNIARMFAQAKASAPCILFIDQIDVLASSRGSTHTSENSGDRIVTGLLTEMDGFFSGSSGKAVEVDVLVLAATNRIEVIDSAILRPGRLDQIVHIPIPDQKTRQAILRGFTSKMPLKISPEEMHELAASTEGYSGADLENLCREAALICLREDISNTEITKTHLEEAKVVSRPSTFSVTE